MRNPGQRYSHDCDRCKFLGPWAEYDLWFCPGERLNQSLIARKGSDPADYASIPRELFESAYLAKPDNEACARHSMAFAVAHERVNATIPLPHQTYIGE